MIVNPQLYNYRLIIGSLVIAIVILSSFSYSSYNKLKESQVFIEQEKNLVENELSEMISSYDEVDVENTSINLKLEKAKSKMNSILDSVKRLKPNAPLISKFKLQIKALKKENVQVMNMIHDLEDENNALKAETKRFANVIIKNKNESKTLKTENQELVKVNSNLKVDLEKAKKLTATSVTAQGVKRVTSRRIVDTDYAGKANKFHVCFTLANNKFAEKGAKEIYIQVLDSKMNVIADKGTASFGEKTLIYSEKKTVQYNNEDLKVCSIIEKRPDDSLDKGVYFVTIVHKGEIIGKTSIELK